MERWPTSDRKETRRRIARNLKTGSAWLWHEGKMMEPIDLHEALDEVHRLRGVIGAILQTACDADDGDPKELLGQIADQCAKEPWLEPHNVKVTGAPTDGAKPTEIE